MNDLKLLFNDFINNVFCRRDSNQHKAKLIWDQIKHHVPEKQRSGFETEWNHYTMGEFTPQQFTCDIESIKQYFIPHYTEA